MTQDTIFLIGPYLNPLLCPCILNCPSYEIPFILGSRSLSIHPRSPETLDI